MWHKTSQFEEMERRQRISHEEWMARMERAHANQFSDLAKENPHCARQFLGSLPVDTSVKVMALALATEIQAGHLRDKKRDDAEKQNDQAD